MMRTANPALNDKSFAHVRSTEGTMTIQGAVNKTVLLVLLAMGTAGYVWYQYYTTANLQALSSWLVGGSIGAFIMALITIFKKDWAMVTAPAYALLEGLALGAISTYFEAMYPGVVIQAIALTLATLFALLAAYKSGVIQATENFKLGIVAATGGIALVYLVSFVLGFFDMTVPYIHESGTVGIIFSLVVVTVAALNLVLDFDFIESAAERGVPKRMEWYGAFGLMVTLVWLYLEILRLLVKLQSRD
jgi:uncharacterized YccA/Bax inhibitor family protein